MNKRARQVIGRKLREGDMILIRRYPQQGDDWDIIMKIKPYRSQDDDSNRTGVRVAYFDRDQKSSIMLYPEVWFWVFANELENQIPETDASIINKVGRAKRAFDFDTP